MLLFTLTDIRRFIREFSDFSIKHKSQKFRDNEVSSRAETIFHW